MKRALIALAGMAFCGFASAEIFDPPLDMVVAVPVANVRAKQKPHNRKYRYDELQETQALEGERVRVFEKDGKWMRVECPDQQEFTHNSRWQGYPGWIEADNLTDDLEQMRRPQRMNVPIFELREKIIEQASRHIGSRYLWGGRSLYDRKNRKVATGVDCSGLINWAFLQVGWKIPRDAHEIFMKSRSRRPTKMQPADLIFLAKAQDPRKIVHVMFYAGDGDILEAPQSGDAVRRLSFLERFGRSITEFRGGEQVGDRNIYFGTLFEEE